MKPCVPLLVCLLAAASIAAPAAALDLTEVAAWGPPTPADTLALRLNQARWSEDDAAFDQVKETFWRRYPHNETVLDALASWHRDHQTLPLLLDALAGGTAEAFTGLEGLTEEDRLFLEASALSDAGRNTSAIALFDRLLANGSAGHPRALVQLYWCTLFDPGSGDRHAQIAREALASPEAAVIFLVQNLSTSPWHANFQDRDAIRAVLADRPSRPLVDAFLAAEAAMDQVREPGLTRERFDDIVDRLAARHPGIAAGYLDDLIHSAVVWLAPAVLRDLLADRIDAVPPRKAAKCEGMLWDLDDADHEAYRIFINAPRSLPEVPDKHILRRAGAWHPDAAEVEPWARYDASDDLSSFLGTAERVLRDLGRTATADSLHALGARENPFTDRQNRLQSLLWSDPGAAHALLDSLVAQQGEAPYGWQLMLQAESAGDHDFIAGFQERHGPFLTAQYFTGAVYGAQGRGDGDRLAELWDMARSLAPDNTIISKALAHAALATGSLELAGKIIDDLSARPYAIPGLAMLRIDAAARARDIDRTRTLLEALAADPDALVDDLILAPGYAQLADRPDLADRILARLDAAAGGCRAVAMAHTHILQLRGDLEGARTLALGVQEDWPGSAEVQAALESLGGGVREYEDPSRLDGESLAGLEFDYTATDWILDRLAKPDEFPDQEILILRDRTTYYLATRMRAVTRYRSTVQVLSEAAAQQSTTIRVPFLSDDDPPRVLCARIITPSGEVREVPRNQILITAHQDETADVSDSRDLVIPFAGLKAGMVIDYAYQKPMPTFLDIGDSWSYRFGQFLPQREEIVEVLAAKGVDPLLYTKHEPCPAETQELPGATLTRWRLEDTVPLTVEIQAPFSALMPHWIGCTTMDGWDSLAGRYHKAFSRESEATDDTRALAKRLTAGAKDDRERAQRVFKHVQEEVANIGIELGPGRLVPTRADEVLSRGYGDCKDKVATLSALCASVGLECLPVLVGTRPSREVEDGFPASDCFNHLIAWFPKLDGGTFADPTLGTGCLADIPEEVAGQRGLLMHADGSSKLVRIPELSSDEPAIDIEVDLYPEPGGTLRAETKALLRRSLAAVVKPLLQMPDTTVNRSMIAVVAGNQADDDLALLSWSWRELECGAVSVEAVFRDSSWAASNDNDAFVVWVTTADVEASPPEQSDRTLPVSFDAPQRYRVTLRAHETPDWRLSTRHSPIAVSAPGFKGDVEVAEQDTDGDHRLEIRRELVFTRRDYTVDDFLKARDQYFSYLLAGWQPVRYQRQSDEARLKEMRTYCREHPDDAAFSFQAAIQVLGGDMGGDGEAGKERRALGRELLGPALAFPDAGGMPFLLAATIASKDGGYLKADSLIKIGLEREPQQPYLLAFAVYLSMELSHDEEAVAYLRRSQVLGGQGASYRLISLLLAMGKDDEARQEEERLHLIAASVDSIHLIAQKIHGYAESNRQDQVHALLPLAERLFETYQFQQQESDVASRERRWNDAIETLEPVHNDRPLDPGLNNNMAWYLACAGRDLERAEYLVRMAIALSGSKAGYENTLGVVLMQQRRWKEAREIFGRLMRDERPVYRVLNGYFYGLCDWLEGNKDKAIACWRGLEPHLVRGQYTNLVKETLAVVDAGKDPSWLYVWPPQDAQ